MLKLLSGEWYAAEAENVAIRDRLRATFWRECGIKPARKTSEVDIAPTARLELMAQLVKVTLLGKEEDEELQRITQLAGTSVAGLALGTFSSPSLGLAPEHSDLAPKIMRAFFTPGDRTTFELNRR
ncbi:hypothetical protein C8J27_106276 [Rhodobacter aestuarii]|uniref:Uncharacterized protein n=1 Tax=Rhodobacter aestuarii TaxID=453582 RepID=A0A1N7MCX0_9RHOB|nr:hypothetical protein [Rhodobacter aestuarii]PTV95006.1 hypothetical protein C8J27_106276 [Rhodobacter aestuarii]SIS84005.1 hypothetical protein SAMN05421580_105276 [Rhodobacter aestuarii]